MHWPGHLSHPCLGLAPQCSGLGKPLASWAGVGLWLKPGQAEVTLLRGSQRPGDVTSLPRRPHDPSRQALEGELNLAFKQGRSSSS